MSLKYIVGTLFSLCAYAQLQTGTISGTVSDPQGAVVPGVAVEARNTGTNTTARATSNERGFFTMPGLAVGQYEINAQKTGFKRAVRAGIVLQVNQNAEVSFALEVGQVAETIEVTGQQILVDTGSATLGNVIENRRVSDLPLNGRNALALTLLTPGVISNAGPTNSGFGDRGIQISSLSINGSPSSMNAQMLDGNNNVLSYVGEVGIPPAVDAVEEFKVQSGSMSAEFGFTAGGAVNLVTKSGTNQFHGTLYEFLRNNALDARNAFATRRLPLRYNQYGGSIGGPAIKNRTFGFFNWEEYRLRQSTPRFSTVPIEPWRRGDFSTLANANGVFTQIFDPATTRNNPAGAGLVRDPFPGNVVPQARFDPITPKMVGYWPAPNRTPSNPFTQAQNFGDDSLTKVDWSQNSTRVDHRFNEVHSIFLRYTDATHAPKANNIYTDPRVGQNREDNQTNRNAMISDTYTFSPTMINNLRVGLMRQSFIFRAINAGPDWRSILALPASYPNEQLVQVDFGFGPIGGGAVGNRGSLNWDIQNMLTKVAGNHTVKIGYNHRILQGSNRQGGALAGNFSFGGLTNQPLVTTNTGNAMAQFLMGEVGSASIDRIIGNTWQALAISTFVQDDWKVARRLTVNLGLRWDWQQKPYERHDGHINFDPNGTAEGFRGVTVYAGKNGQPRSFYKEDFNDFGPRIGWAWDIFGKGTTVFRGGYGVFYPSIFYRNFLGDTQLFSTTNTQYVAQGPGQRALRFRDGFPRSPLEAPGAAAGPLGLLGQTVAITENDPTTPMTQQWNAGLQHQIGDWVFDVSYAGNKGNHFVGNGYNLNQLDPQLRLRLRQDLFTTVPNPFAGRVPGGLGAATITRERSLQPFPYYNGVNVRNPRLGNYNSHQLQVNVRKRMKNGLLVDVAFTGGKRIADSAIVPVDFGPIEQVNEGGFQDGLFNRQINKSVDPADVSRRLVINGLYELPFGRGKRFDTGNGVMNRIVGGWQLNVIGVFQTGTPLTVRGAANFGADRPNSTGKSANLPAGERTARRWFDTAQFVNPPDFEFGNVSRGLPDVRHPGTINFDSSLIKDTQVTERIRLQFRAEAFNVFNKVNLGLVNDNFNPGPDGKNAAALFGVINSSRDARIMQLGLKLIF
jgi:hypothetical protein